MHEEAALNSTVNSPETADSKTFETSKIDKNSTNVPNATLKKYKIEQHKTANLSS